MSSEDMRIIGRVRGVLGKHFLDIDNLHIASSKGVVRVQGTFKRLGQLASVMPVTEKFLHDLKMEINRLPGVNRVLVSQGVEGGEGEEG